MAEVASAYVSLIPSAKGFGRGIQSQIGGDLASAGKSGGKRLGGGLASTFLPATKAMAGAAAGLFAAAKIGGFLKDSIAEAREAQKVGALTTSIIKSTGGAAKISAAQVGALATSISNKTGMDDEAIQSGANLLLTFKNVRNEAGKGNDVFNQATQAAADLSAAGFGDLNGASKQLGKALNDPIKGIAALGRSGVTFTDQQKKQIKTLVASGKTLEAQKIILKEVQSQVGGAAAASATGGEKLAVAFGNFKEQIGTALLPIIDKVAGFLTTKIIPALSGFITGMQDGTGSGAVFAGFIKGIFSALQPVGAFITGSIIPALKVFFSFLNGNDTGVDGPFREMAVAGQAARGVIASMVGFFQTQVIPAFQAVAAFVSARVIPAILGIVSAVRGFIIVALPIVQQFVAGMMARIGPMMPAIRAIFGQIGSIVVGALTLIRTIVTQVTALIAVVWNRWGSNIMTFISAIFRAVVTIIGGALNIIQGIIKTVTSLIRGDWSGAWAGIKQIVSGAWQVIKGVVSAAMTVLKSVISIALTGLSALWGKAWGALKGAASSAFGSVVAYVKSIPGQITGALGDLGGLLRGAGQAIIDGLKRGIEDKIGEVKATLNSLTDKLPDWKGPAKKDKTLLTPAGRSVIQGFINGIAQATPGVKTQLQGLTKALIRYGKDKLSRSLSDENAALLKVTSQRLTVASKLKSAQSKLAAAVKTRDDYAASVRSSFESFGRITDGGPAAETIIAKLRSDVARAKTFQSNLTALMKMGLSKAAYKQIVDAGVEQGGTTAAALVAGGKGSVKQVNALVGQLSTTANSVASQASKALYQAGVDSAAGLVKGLESQGSALAAAAQRIARNLVAQVKKALGIKSPSRVFAKEVGAHIPTGVIRGMDSTQGRLDRRLGGLVGVPNVPTTGSGSGRFGVAEMQMLTAALERARLSANVSAGSLDRAIMTGVR